MRDRAGVRVGLWPLVGTLILGFTASTLLAERSENLYGFVAAMLVSGAVLFAIHRRCFPTARTVLGVALLLRLVAFPLLPGLSDDAFRYVWDGRLQHEGVNPYLYAPSELEPDSIDESLYEKLNSRSFRSVYPPVSQIVFFLGSWAPSDNWSTSFYTIKLIICIIEFLAVIGLLRATSPGHAMVYAWNPVVVMEVAGQAHTEGITAGLLVIAVLLVRQKRPALAGTAISAAGLVKLFPFVALPLVWRRGGWKTFAASLLAGLILAAPYLAGGALFNILDSLKLYVTYFEFNAGPYYAAKGLLAAATGQDLGKWIGPAFAWLFAALLPFVYVIERRNDWRFEKALITVFALFVLLSTTVHPWYIVPLLALIVLEDRIRWHWYWMGLLSVGTYLLYVDGPYWPFVWLAWGTWLLLAGLYHADPALQWLQRRRGVAKWEFVEPWISETRSVRLLDLGAGEGYVGLAASRISGARVTLADVIDLNRTSLPFKRVEPDQLAFETGAFDYVLLYFVLHHSADPRAVLQESARVARRGVIVVESVCEGRIQHLVLGFLDRVVNRIRSGGQMKEQEAHLRFRSHSEWLSVFSSAGLNVVGERAAGNWIHRKAAFVVAS